MGRQTTPQAPFCIIAREQFSMLRTMRIPEDRIPLVEAHGWMVLIRDSEMPMPWPKTPKLDRLLSGTNRRTWLNEADVRDDFQDEEGL